MITKAWRSKIIAIGITIGVLFSLATYTVTPVIGQEQELGYDDGSPEFGFVAGPSVAGAVKFTVPSSVQVLKLKFHVWGEMKTVRVHVLDANFKSIFSKEVIPSIGWFEVDVSSNNVFVQGDFHVAWQWISESPNGPWLDVDTTPPHHQRSYLGVPGSSPIPAQPNEDYMIRVVVREAGQQEVKFRGVVIGSPDFGGAVGVGGVNIRIDEVLLDPTSNLEIGDVATVTWPMVPPFAYIQVEIGDRVEVYGYYNTQEMPDWWSGVGEHWVSLSTSDHYLEKVEEKPRVKFRGTAACDEDRWYNPSKPYGNYFVDVVVDEIIDDPYGKLVQGALYCVAYQDSHGFSEGECVEVYGTYIEGTIVVGGAYGSPGDYIKECASPELALARKFSPVLWLHSQEKYEPEEVRIMVDRAALQNPLRSCFPFYPPIVEAGDLTVPRLAQYTGEEYWGYYLDLPLGLREDADFNYEHYRIEYEQVKDQDRYFPATYARIKSDGQHVTIQYWLFYYFNKWLNNHEGDWENITLVFNEPSVEFILDNNVMPISAAYSEHFSAGKKWWSELEVENDTHPVVYVAKGSHANYFTPGGHIYGLDKTEAGTKIWPEVILIPETPGTEWLRFTGHWGEQLCLDPLSSGPESLQVRDEYRNPYIWAAMEDPGLRDEQRAMTADKATNVAQSGAFEAIIASPAEIHVYDSVGRHVGPDNAGGVDLEIPGALYLEYEGTNEKRVVIPNPDVTSGYKIYVLGIASGTCDLITAFPDSQHHVVHTVQYFDVTVNPASIAELSIASDTDFALKIDVDGNGIFETEKNPDVHDTHTYTPLKYTIYLPVIFRNYNP